MRVIFMQLFLLTLQPSVFCQNSLSSKNTTTKLSEKERWNLDKYVWSHTHYKTSNNDKPAIDFDAMDNWEAVGLLPGDKPDVSISPDGLYIAYTTTRGSSFLTGGRQQDSLIVQSTVNAQRWSFSKLSPGFFFLTVNNTHLRIKTDCVF